MLRHRTKGLHPGNGVAPGRPGDRENLASELKGKTIVAVTEARYLKNEATILSRRVRRLGASEKSKAIPYSELFTDPEGIEADILILRSSRLETALSGEIIRSLFEFREHHPPLLLSSASSSGTHSSSSRNQAQPMFSISRISITRSSS